MYWPALIVVPIGLSKTNNYDINMYTHAVVRCAASFAFLLFLRSIIHLTFCVWMLCYQFVCDELLVKKFDIFGKSAYPNLPSLGPAMTEGPWLRSSNGNQWSVRFESAKVVGFRERCSLESFKSDGKTSFGSSFPERVGCYFERCVPTNGGWGKFSANGKRVLQPIRSRPLQPPPRPR